ncbi:MAG: DUF4065 domain-containing protein, partial [Erysipelotrichales bacterium]|nr:DUF4065 domain-containing protein [Erysipelotrichales bacterium]
IKTNNHTDLLDLFDNFHALPYGPVESDIYNQIANDKIPNYTITDRGIIKKEFFKELSLSAENIQKLDNSLKMLRGKNDNLIVLPAFTLVDITHKWESWDKAFKYAKFIGSGSTKMNIEHIRNDKVHYFGN